jgi:low temperature requirement protein LtrA
MGALLIVGVTIGGTVQTILFAAAVFGEWLSIYVTSRSGSWRIHSSSHWTERYGLFVLIVLGESLVAVGVGAAEEPIGTSLLFGAALGVGASLCLWWLYFDIVGPATERRMEEADADERVRIGLEAYCYGHFPIVAGVVVAAAGIEGALAHAEEPGPLGGFYGFCLFGGIALYLCGHLIFDRRVLGARNRARVIAAVVTVAAAPAVLVLSALAALALATTILAVLVVYERLHFAQLRREYCRL